MASGDKQSIPADFHPHLTPIAEVRRRPSPLDLPPQSWAVVGLGGRGLAAMTGLGSAGLPVLGFDRITPNETVDVASTRYGHEVIALAEIDAIDAIAVTSQDWMTGEINTDYFAGLLVATGLEPVAGGDAPDLLPEPDSGAVFSPHHPAVIDLTNCNQADVDHMAAALPAFVALLATAPRSGLSLHRAIVRAERQGTSALAAMRQGIRLGR
jgi:hypothetical protein